MATLAVAIVNVTKVSTVEASDEDRNAPQERGRCDFHEWLDIIMDAENMVMQCSNTTANAAATRRTSRYVDLTIGGGVVMLKGSVPKAGACLERRVLTQVASTRSGVPRHAWRSSSRVCPWAVS